MQMRAAVLYEANTLLQVEEVTLDDPKDQEILVKMVATGVCHSNLGIIKGENPSPLPIVLGHEGRWDCGEGRPRRDSGPARRPCGASSDLYVREMPTLCSEVMPAQLMGKLPGGRKPLHKGDQELNIFYVSAFAEYVVVPERMAVKVRDEIPLVLSCINQRNDI